MENIYSTKVIDLVIKCSNIYNSMKYNEYLDVYIDRDNMYHEKFTGYFPIGGYYIYMTIGTNEDKFFAQAVKRCLKDFYGITSVNIKYDSNLLNKMTKYSNIKKIDN